MAKNLPCSNDYRPFFVPHYLIDAPHLRFSPFNFNLQYCPAYTVFNLFPLPLNHPRKIGFYGIFSISASLYLVAFFYGVFFVPEVDIVNEKERLKAQEKSALADFFDKEHVMETFRVAFKQGERQRRLRVIMLMIVVMVVIGPLHG